jgi:hypothetical protein
MITRTSATAVAIATCLLFAAPAAAVDGEILIDQAKVNAGGITPDDTPGFPATLSKSGRYKLSGNLRVSTPTSAILVTADDVTIDLNGFTIFSNPPGAAGTGVFALTSTKGLRVMNGTITGFGGFGVTNRQNEAGQFAVLENMRIVSNGAATNSAGVFLGARSRIRNSTIADNQGGNVLCLQDCLLEGNIVAGSGNGAGISMNGGTALGNVIVSNKFLGLQGDAKQLGYGNNILLGNNSGGSQVGGAVVQLHPNVCDPACP